MKCSPYRLAFVASCIALVCTLMCAEARATTIIPMSDEDLALSSRAIVEGRVTSVDVQANAEHTAVFTFISFRLTRVIKGDLVRGQTIVIKQLGGRIGPDATQLFGLPFFAPRWRMHIKFTVNPENSPTPSGGFDEAKAVASAWSLIPGSALRVTIGDNTTSKCGFRMDGTTAISFGDCEDDIDDPVNCTGVVAIGGISAAVSNATSTVGGETFFKAIEGDVVFNDGFECLTSNPLFVEEVLCHELGHALGFGHSSTTPGEPSDILSDAVMYYAAHNDDRGASIRLDDEDAARFLYRGEGDGTDLAIKTDALPDAPLAAPYSFTLVAAGSGPFTWSVDSGELPSGLALSGSGVISGAADADALAMVTFKVRDSANFVQTRTLELKATATPAPFLISGKYEDEKLILTGLNLGLESLVTVNDVEVAPPTPVKFKAEKGKITLKGKPADLNFVKGEKNTASVIFGGQTSNTLTF